MTSIYDNSHSPKCHLLLVAGSEIALLKYHIYRRLNLIFIKT